VQYSIIDYVHKHKIKISEVKKLGLERTRRRWRLGWTMARKRTVQLLTALAETRLVVRQRRMLVALCPISSNNGSYNCCSTHDGSSDFLCASYVDGGTGNSDVEATDGGPRVAAECHQKEIGRAGQVGWRMCLCTQMDILGSGVDADGFLGYRDGGGRVYMGL